MNEYCVYSIYPSTGNQAWEYKLKVRSEDVMTTKEIYQITSDLTMYTKVLKVET